MKLKTPILITGASGFVGANLLQRLVKETKPTSIHVILRKSSNTWRVKDILKKVCVHILDLQDQNKTYELLQKIKPKTIFHLATHGAYPYQQEHEKEILDTNIICTFNLMQASLKIDFDAFINTGTSSEYGINQKPMKEEDLLVPVTSYGVSKAWATLYGQYLSCSVRKAPITTLRLFGVYGFYEPLGRLIPNVITSLVKSQQPILTSPNFKRDFVFIDDVTNAYIRAAEKRHLGMVFNIGSGKKTSLKKLFYLIKDILKVGIEPILGNSKYDLGDTNRRIADIKLAQKYLDWEPKIDLEHGLQRTVDWFLVNKSLYK